MLIKEYRIPLPLTVDEYRIAQRYMIQKKSREESEGKESGVQFVINEPSVLDDGRPCQYTKKYFFVMRHIPSWLKSILPSSVLSVLRLTEEAWNAYPYTRTKFYSDSLTKLNVHVETVYLPDYGNQDNVFNLKNDELRRRIVDVVDVVNDPVDDAEYVAVEDLTKYHSTKTDRGPLNSTWLKEYAAFDKESVDADRTRLPVMCAYKLMKVDCHYWGFQTKVENFLHDSSRKVMLRSHKQAFAWTDEWYDLSMNDILTLEYETQQILAEKFQTAASESLSPKKSSPPATVTTSTPSTPVRTRKTSSTKNQQIADSTVVNKPAAESLTRISPQRSVSSTNLDLGGVARNLPSSIKPTVRQQIKSTSPPTNEANTSALLQTQKQELAADRTLASPSGSAHSIFDQCLRRDSVAADEDIFYDAFESLQTTTARGTNEIEQHSGAKLQQCNLLEPVQYARREQQSPLNDAERLVSWSTTKHQHNNADIGIDNNDDEDTSSTTNADCLSANLHHVDTAGVLAAEFPRAELLILIFHGGCLLERGLHVDEQPVRETATSSSTLRHDFPAAAAAPLSVRASKSAVLPCASNPAVTLCHESSHPLPPVANIYGDAPARRLDLSGFRSTLDTVLTTYYPMLKDKVAVRVVPCPAICAPFVKMLRSLLPFSYAVSTTSTLNAQPKNMDFSHLSALPLFAMNNADYQNKIATVIESANHVYQEFLESAHGIDFDGKVVVVGDSCGALLAYDAICTSLNFKITASNAKSPGIVSWDSAGSQPATSTATTTSPAVSTSAPVPDASRDDQPRHIFRYAASMVFDNKSPPQLRRSVSPLATAQARRKPVQLLTAPTAGDSSTEITSSNYGLPVTHRSNSDSRLGVLRHSPLSLVNSAGEGTLITKDYLIFDAGDLFTLGSPLGLVLAYRLANSNGSEQQDSLHAAVDTAAAGNNLLNTLNPHCQIYNLYYSSDPSATRIEPLLLPAFARVAPGALPRYEKFPLGDGSSQQIFDVLHANRDHLPSDVPSKFSASLAEDVSSALPDSGRSPAGSLLTTAALVQTILKYWWGTKRLDYAVYSPDRLEQMPHQALPFLFHASYWESLDVVAFIMRQIFVPAFLESAEVSLPLSIGGGQRVMRGSHFDSSGPHCSSGMLAMRLLVNFPIERWQKRTTYLKIRNMSPNHRANDVVTTERCEQVLQARFAYGMLDMASLSGEKVDIYILLARARHRRKSVGGTEGNAAQCGAGATSVQVASTIVADEARNWQLVATEVTDKYGRVQYVMPTGKKLTFGQYPVRFVVRGDHTFTDCNIAVMPPGTELVVFSIDGSFTASMSVSGRDPKVRPGAVDVVRHWQELGFLILYVSGRPLMQRRNISTWLAQHNFPFGMFHFTDGVAYDPLGQKRDYLLSLQQAGFLIHGAYGSSKDVAIYNSAQVPSDKIYAVGKLSRKQIDRALFLKDGYAAHLAKLAQAGGSRPARGNGRFYVNKGVLPLPADAYVLSSRESVHVTDSLAVPLVVDPSAAIGPPGAAIAGSLPIGRFQRVKHIVRYHSMRHSSSPQQSPTTTSDETVRIETKTVAGDNNSAVNTSDVAKVHEHETSHPNAGGAVGSSTINTVTPRQCPRQ